MIELLVHVLALLASPDDVEAVRRTAPEPVAYDVAAEYLAAAELVGGSRHVDPNLILYIVGHESRFSDARTAEAGGKTSCGPMTPIPKRRCTTQSTYDGIREGTDHLLDWLKETHGNMRRAILGYAGGHPLLDACDRDGRYVIIRRGVQIDLCKTSDVFLTGAARVKRARWIARKRGAAKAV